MQKALLALMTAFVLPWPAAAEPLASELALARRLFAEARTAEEGKDWPAAGAKLRDAIAIKETPGLRFHLAYCEEQEGALVEALVDYERAADLPTGPNEEFRTQIPARRTSLLKRIPTVMLLPNRDIASISLSVDSHPLPGASFGKPIPLNPGKHVFTVAAPGYVGFTTEISLHEGDAVVTNAVLVPEGNQPISTTEKTQPGAAVDNQRGGAGLPTRTYVLLGEGALTLAALTAGIVFTLEASSEDERADRAHAALPGATPADKTSGCTPPAKSPAICADLAKAIDSANNDRSLARAGLIGAALGATVAVGTLVLWPRQRSGQASISPWIGPGGGGLWAAGRF